MSEESDDTVKAIAEFTRELKFVQRTLLIPSCGRIEALFFSGRRLRIEVTEMNDESAAPEILPTQS